MMDDGAVLRMDMAFYVRMILGSYQSPHMGSFGPYQKH